MPSRDSQTAADKDKDSSDKGVEHSAARKCLESLDQREVQNSALSQQRLTEQSHDLVRQGILANCEISGVDNGTEIADSRLKRGELEVFDNAQISQSKQEQNLRVLGQTDNLLPGKFHPEGKTNPLEVSQQDGGMTVTIPRSIADGEQWSVTQSIDYKLNNVTDAQKQWSAQHVNGPELGHIMHVQFKAKVGAGDLSDHGMTVQLCGSQAPYDQALSERVNLKRTGQSDANGYQTFDFYSVAPSTTGDGKLNLKFNFDRVQNGGSVDFKDITVKEVNNAPGLNPSDLVSGKDDARLSQNFMIGAGANQLTADNVAVPPDLKKEASQKFPGNPELQANMIREYQKQHALDPLDQEKYLQRMKEMGINTVTVPIYWNQIEKKQGQADYAKVDQMIDLCKKYDMHVKLHPIVWGDCYPAWADKTGESAQNTIDKHIDDVIQHFGKKVDYIEVNEVNSTDLLRHQSFDAAGPNTSAAVNNGLTRWAAREGAAAVINHVDETIRNDLNKYGSHAKLLENEYVIDQKTLQNDRQVSQNSEHPDALGVQMHQFNGNFPALRMEQMLQERSASKLPVYISEITAMTSDARSVDMSKLSAEVSAGLARETSYREQHHLPDLKMSERNAQIRQAEQLLTMYKLAAANKNVDGISLWDYTDRNAWNGNTGGVLDSNLDPKVSYYALQAYLKTHSQR